MAGLEYVALRSQARLKCRGGPARAAAILTCHASLKIL